MTKTSRRDFVKRAGFGVAGMGLPRLRKQPPNFLVLYPDQWRYDWTEQTAGLDVRLPNLAGLAKRGMSFTHAVVASPLCAPSRACLASGREYERCGVPGNKVDYPLDQGTYYGLLRSAGYHVLGCGKIDLHKATFDWGIDGKRCLPQWGFSDGIDNEGKFDALWSAKDASPKGPYVAFLRKLGLMQTHLDDFAKRFKEGYRATYPTPLPEEAYCDNWITANAVGLLRSAPKGKPWHLAVNFTGPHDPEDITVRMEATCRDRVLPQPNQSTQYDRATHNRIRQNYTAMCENIDRQVGVLIDEVRSRGELDNTYVIFSSDHGEMLGDHDRWGKQVPYEASVRVPLVVAGPLVQSGTSSPALISHIDLAATMLDLAGVPDALQLDRRSFRHVLSNPSMRHRDFLRSSLGSWKMVTDGRHKLIVGFDTEAGKFTQNGASPMAKSKESSPPATVLFDLVEDPLERRNIASESPAEISRLSALLPASQT